MSLNIRFRYSPDSALLKLQEVAKKNHLGCIWSGVTKNFVLGLNQHDDDNDESLQPFKNFDREDADIQGFPLKFFNGVKMLRFAPWHERSVKKRLEKGQRCDHREHRNLSLVIPYGFTIDMSLNL